MADHWKWMLPPGGKIPQMTITSVYCSVLAPYTRSCFTGRVQLFPFLSFWLSETKISWERVTEVYIQFNSTFWGLILKDFVSASLCCSASFCHHCILFVSGTRIFYFSFDQLNACQMDFMAALWVMTHFCWLLFWSLCMCIAHMHTQVIRWIRQDI